MTSRSLPALALVALALSSGCARVTSDCPPWPEAGPAVAAEMDQVPEAGFESFWDWIDRLEDLRDQLRSRDSPAA